MARPTQRGAAMTEFVLLLPVIIAMWMGIEYFRSGYARRLAALGNSQAAAWNAAYSNDMSCFGFFSSFNFGWLAGGGADLAGGGDNAQQAFSQFGSNNKQSSAFRYGWSSKSDSMSTRVAGWDKTKGSVSGKTYLLCNEVVPGPSKDQDILTPLKGFITGLFKF